MSDFWKPNWDQTRQRFIDWWAGKGLVLVVKAPRDEPLEDIPEPPPPATLEEYYLDPTYRAWQAEYQLAHTYFGGEAFPFYQTDIGPGNLATFLGSEPRFAPDTVWFQPCIDDPANAPNLRFDPENIWFKRQIAIIEACLRVSRGRFLVSIPDLIENVDILASLRGTGELLTDMLDRPDFVKQKVAEINQVYFAVFDAIRALVQDPWGGNAMVFDIWGPGRTAKVQCDASAMFSPQMFGEFVVPALREQCAWLDYSLFHLDGTACIRHLDQLLEIEDLNAIEFTAEPTVPTGGSPHWYDLYRRILRAGKSVQAIQVRPEEVVPLLDAVGGAGMHICVQTATEAEARAVVEQAEQFR